MDENKLLFMGNIISNLGPKVENWRGKLDKNFYESLVNEGIDYESTKVFVTVKSDKLQGKNFFSLYYKEICRGSIIITSNRFIAIVKGHKLMDVPKDHSLFKEIIFDYSDPNRFNIFFDFNKFPNQFEGSLNLGYKLPSEEVKEWLNL
ncbi:MAG: hypothetical protein ACXVHR_08415 [Methanobacterium sp.]